MTLRLKEWLAANDVERWLFHGTPESSIRSLEPRDPRPGGDIDQAGNVLHFDRPLIFATPSIDIAVLAALMMQRGRWGWCSHVTDDGWVGVTFLADPSTVEKTLASGNTGSVYAIPRDERFHRLPDHTLPGVYTSEVPVDSDDPNPARRMIRLTVEIDDLTVNPRMFPVPGGADIETFIQRDLFHQPWAGKWPCSSGGYFQFDPVSGTRRDATRVVNRNDARFGPSGEDSALDADFFRM